MYNYGLIFYVLGLVGVNMVFVLVLLVDIFKVGQIKKEKIKSHL